MNSEYQLVTQIEFNPTNIYSLGDFLYDLIKRFFDIIISLLAVLLLIPVTITIKIAYVLNQDYNSIFYTQKRIGINGKEFTLYKFRSMVVGADQKLDILLRNKKIYKEYEINKKISDDPRITKVGKFLRKNSIDELPQLINILKGDMSLIGNRPYLPKEKTDMGIYYNEIIKTKPGLTGLWQTSGRSKTTFNKRLILESWYSNNKSLKLDIKIFFKTFKEVFINKFAK